MLEVFQPSVCEREYVRGERGVGGSLSVCLCLCLCLSVFGVCVCPFGDWK